MKDLPVRATQCSTCPFKKGSGEQYECLAPTLTVQIMESSSHICHQTGSNNAFHARTGQPPHLCRGARDIQLQMFCALGAIAEPTDEAWNTARVEIGMKPLVIKDPGPMKESKQCK